MGTCQILNVSRVMIPPGPYPAPGEAIHLSLFDAVWVSLPHIQRLFLYPDTNIPFPSIVESLKSSLTCILPFFHPFVGKLTYVPSTCEAIVDCSPVAVGEGVAFIEAESDIDIHGIAACELHDLESFMQLVPDISVTELPAAILAVQVTRFAGGGVAIGLAVHHTVSDGKGLWRFIEAWAAASLKHEVPSRPMPMHDRLAITVPGGDEIAKKFMRKMCPHLPKMITPQYSIKERLRLARRTFIIDSSKINLLKQKALFNEKPSTFIALSAQALVSIARARKFDDDSGPFIAAFLTDCRSRLNPPIVEGYIGNCVSHCFAWSTGSEIAGPDGFKRACAVLKEAIRKATEEPLAECEGWADKFIKLPAGRVVFLVGSPRFRAYDTDFGWGKPSRVELASMNHDGEVVLLGGKDDGTIQVSVALSGQHMDEFARMFNC